MPGFFKSNKKKQSKPSKYEKKKNEQLNKVRNMFNSFNISKEYIDHRLGNVLLIDEENKQIGIFIDMVDYIGESFSYNTKEQKYIIPLKKVTYLGFHTASGLHNRTGFFDFEIKSLGRDFVEDEVNTIFATISDNETIILNIKDEKMNNIDIYFTEVDELKACFKMLMGFMEQAYEEKEQEELKEKLEFIGDFNEENG